ncbi:MAG: hypothetical protein M3R72_07595 [Bacteroidota bacterium]|nr:hypothetical protein [Bacteroidota bacterium]
MPEENFEQKVRKMAEQFSMEPQPVVWQRVKEAIAPKRRRRAAFVWWLLPLCAVGGLVFWLLNSPLYVQNQTAIAIQKSGTKTDTNSLKKVTKPNEEKKSEKATNSIGSNEKNMPSIPKKSVRLFVVNNKSDDKEKSTKPNAEATSFQPKTNFAGDTNRIKEKDIKEKSEATSIQSHNHVLLHNNASADSNLALQNPQTIVADTVKMNATIGAKTNDTLTGKKDSSFAVINKKKGKTKWQFGLMAEGGTSWLGNALFGNQLKSLSDFSSVTAGASNGSTQTTSTQQQRKNGVDAALGIAAKTNVSKRWFLEGELGYRYQQIHIQTTLFTSIPTSLNGNIIRSNANYHFQSANLYTGIGLYLFHKKTTSVAVQAGIDNGWLFSVKTKDNDSAQNLTAKGFQRWLPSLQLAVPVRIQAGKNIYWQLSPFVRWGLRGLQKSGGSFEHHPLNSAGIKVNYFFK